MNEQPDPGRSWRLGLVIAITGFTTVMGLIFRHAQLTALSEALWISLGLSWLWARVALSGLKVRRIAPDQATEDEWIVVRAEVCNTGLLPALRVEVEDRFSADPLFSRADLLPLVAPGETRDLIFERPCVRGRGVFRLGPCEVAVSDPLGLFRLTRTEGLTGEVVVYPRALPLDSLGLVSVLEQTFSGSAARPRPGSGIQLLGLRELRPSERAQRIHWRASARLSRLVASEFEAPSRSEVTIFLDMSHESLRGVGRGSNMETAVRLAAAVMQFALDHAHPVGLIADDGDPRVFPARHGRQQRITILDALARLQPRGEVDFLDLLGRSAALVPGGGSVILVLNQHTLDAERFIEVWAPWQRRGVRAQAFVVDDRKLLAREWNAEAPKHHVPAVEFLTGLGIGCLEVGRAEDLEGAALEATATA